MGAAGPALKSVWDVVDGMKVHGRASDRALARQQREVVFVHGLGMSTRYMEPTMRELAGDFPVSGLDLPGFGRTQVSRGRVLSLRALAQVLGGWLDARGITAPILVGNSHGAQVIAELVWRSPRRAAGLVLSAPTMEAGHRWRYSQIMRAIMDAPREPLSLAPLVLRAYLRAGPTRVLGTLSDALADRIEDKLPRVGVPTAIVCGDRDPLAPPKWCERLARLTGRDVPGSPGAELHVLPGEPHAIPYGAAPALAQLVRGLADRIGGEVP